MTCNVSSGTLNPAISLCICYCTSNKLWLSANMEFCNFDSEVLLVRPTISIQTFVNLKVITFNVKVPF